MVAYSSHEIYSKAEGIYSVLYSNATMGRFLSFNKLGKPKGIRHPFSELEKSARIKVAFNKVLSLNETLKNTMFGIRDPLFNKLVRNCIRHDSRIFNPNSSPHPTRHNKQQNSLRKVIQKCKKRVERKLSRKNETLNAILVDDVNEANSNSARQMHKRKMKRKGNIT
jgi:hypothetical protein